MLCLVTGDPGPVMLSSSEVRRGARHLDRDRDAGRDESGGGGGCSRCCVGSGCRVGRRRELGIQGGLVMVGLVVGRDAGSTAGRSVVMAVGSEGEGIIVATGSRWQHARVLGGLLLQTRVLQIVARHRVRGGHGGDRAALVIVSSFRLFCCCCSVDVVVDVGVT